MFALEWIIFRWQEGHASLTGWGFLLALFIFSAWVVRS